MGNRSIDRPHRINRDGHAIRCCQPPRSVALLACSAQPTAAASAVSPMSAWHQGPRLASGLTGSRHPGHSVVRPAAMCGSMSSVGSRMTSAPISAGRKKRTPRIHQTTPFLPFRVAISLVRARRPSPRCRTRQGTPPRSQCLPLTACASLGSGTKRITAGHSAAAPKGHTRQRQPQRLPPPPQRFRMGGRAPVVRHTRSLPAQSAGPDRPPRMVPA